MHTQHNLLFKEGDTMKNKKQKKAAASKTTRGGPAKILGRTTAVPPRGKQSAKRAPKSRARVGGGR